MYSAYIFYPFFLGTLAKENKEWKKRVKKAEKKGETPKKVKPKWKIKEYDHGIFGEMIQNLDVAPDG